VPKDELFSPPAHHLPTHPYLPLSSPAMESKSTVPIMTVPFPVQCHMNQLMHLSLLLASRGLAVHYAAPEPHLREARARLHG
jgi:cis-zeatin O-glucosyltransferase